MNVLDANVLLSLARADHSHHPAALAWWEDSTSRGEPFTVPDVMWVAFARLSTDRRIFSVPSTFQQAWAFAESMIGQPTYLRFGYDADILSEFTRLAREANATGNLTTDAYVAATASALGGAVVTFDRDFRRFDGVRVTELVG